MRGVLLLWKRRDSSVCVPGLLSLCCNKSVINGATASSWLFTAQRSKEHALPCLSEHAARWCYMVTCSLNQVWSVSLGSLTACAQAAEVLCLSSPSQSTFALFDTCCLQCCLSLIMGRTVHSAGSVQRPGCGNSECPTPPTPTDAGACAWQQQQ